MSSKPTIAQVAELSGVSIATVSRYINNSAGVKPATAQKICDAISSLNYPIPIDCAITNRVDSDIILVNLPSISNPFYHEIIRGIQNSATRYGYRTLVNIQHLNSSSEESFFQLLSTTSFAGAILLNPIEEPFFYRLYKTLPFVQCCEFTPNQNLVSYVSIDDYSAAKKAVEYLFSIGQKKIALLMGPTHYKYSQERKRGYISALEEFGLPVNPAWIVPTPNLDFGTAYSAIHQLLSHKDPPTAIFAVSDVLAVAAIHACQSLNLSVPEDISIIGFDNVSYSQISSPTLTTINQPKYNLGYTACDLLIEQIKNPGIQVQQLLLNTELIIRDSTQKSLF